MIKRDPTSKLFLTRIENRLHAQAKMCAQDRVGSRSAEVEVQDLRTAEKQLGLRPRLSLFLLSELCVIGGAAVIGSYVAEPLEGKILAFWTALLVSVVGLALRWALIYGRKSATE